MELEPSIDFLLLGNFIWQISKAVVAGSNWTVCWFLLVELELSIDNLLVRFLFTDLHSCSSVIESNSEMNVSFGGNYLPFWEERLYIYLVCQLVRHGPVVNY